MTTTPVDLSLKIGSPELVITKNGTKTVVALDAKPIVLDGRTMLPIRPIVEALGGAIGYSDGVVSITQGSNAVTLRIGDNTAVVNGQDVPIDQNPNVKPFIVPPGRTMLPLRFIAEALGAQVNYLGAGNIAIAYPNPNPSQ
ncbi:MAG: copper amine oxidase N-terminal domain-containing protein [Patescibacteria group bacterium]|nr:copper amine oxidase N-terminal domain-containing protein [Patescibacteria group bacterium]